MAFADFEKSAACDELLKRVGCDAFLVRETVNIRWLTGFDGVFDEEQAHALLVLPGGLILHTDSRYTGAARAAAEAGGGFVEVDEVRESHAAFARRKLSSDAVLGFEGSIAYTEFTKLAEQFASEADAPAAPSEHPLGEPAPVPGALLISTTDAFRTLRARKTPAELERLRAAQAISDAAFAHVVDVMRPGMTERQVQRELDDFMLQHSAEALAFRSIVAAGENGADPHAVPSNKRLEAGQCVVIDFGAKAQGYCSDMTRTVFLGQPDGQMAGAWQVLRAANEAVERELKVGMTGREAHELAERVLEEGGFGGCMGHGLGHGVGLDIHELPTLNQRNEQPLVAGNVVTVEPGIYLPGQFGMRLEDFGVITETGFDVFTQTTHEMVII